MVLLRNDGKSVVVNRSNQEELPRTEASNEAITVRINGKYITQISEESEGKVPKKLFQEVRRKENQILGPFSKLNEFHLSSEIPVRSWNIRGSFRDATRGKQELDFAKFYHGEQECKHWLITCFSFTNSDVPLKSNLKDSSNDLSNIINFNANDYFRLIDSAEITSSWKSQSFIF